LIGVLLTELDSCKVLQAAEVDCEIVDDGANVVSRDVTRNVEDLLVLAELVEDIK
jgi:hypothetical protein